MKAILLAAGEGIRLRPLTKERPKALFPVLDHSQMAWAFASLRRAGIDDVIVNAHFHADQISREARALGESNQMSVLLSHEEMEPLGTAGALKYASAHLREEFVILNCDVATDAPIASLIAAHRYSGAVATLLAVPSADQADLIVEDSWITDLVDRREKRNPGFIYGGAAVFDSAAVQLIPDGPAGLFETVLQPLIEGGHRVAAFEWSGYWLDIGTPANYLTANLDALSGSRQSLPEISSQPALYDSAMYVGSGAKVEGVSMRHSIIGSRATIEPGSRLERCVVWDGAHVTKTNYRDAILTPSQVLYVK